MPRPIPQVSQQTVLGCGVFPTPEDNRKKGNESWKLVLFQILKFYCSWSTKNTAACAFRLLALVIAIIGYD